MIRCCFENKLKSNCNCDVCQELNKYSKYINSLNKDDLEKEVYNASKNAFKINRTLTVNLYDSIINPKKYYISKSLLNYKYFNSELEVNNEKQS